MFFGISRQVLAIFTRPILMNLNILPLTLSKLFAVANENFVLIELTQSGVKIPILAC
jgi:hypothetical protein